MKVFNLFYIQKIKNYSIISNLSEISPNIVIYQKSYIALRVQAQNVINEHHNIPQLTFYSDNEWNSSNMLIHDQHDTVIIPDIL